VIYTGPIIRDIERDSIREFLEQNSRIFRGATVLDYGCGHGPYRELVTDAGGHWNGYDRPDLPAAVSQVQSDPDLPNGHLYDAIVCTQVIQYVDDPLSLLAGFYASLREGGHLVMTGPTNWAVVEPEDLWRFTRAGIRRLLEAAGFHIEVLVDRATIELDGFRMPVGWGTVAVA
jgi:2-polyprenyl-3-methyl-5-hydroxy-6-metoxy-1,4-benzoquinol methylase